MSKICKGKLEDSFIEEIYLHVMHGLISTLKIITTAIVLINAHEQSGNEDKLNHRYLRSMY